ncbi:MAG: universal stress protein [Actinomycetes bacterium]
MDEGGRTAAQVVERFVPDGGVVVGEDGSPGAGRAVRYAVAEAARRGAVLHVLRAWSIISAPRPPTWEPTFVPSLPEYEQAVADDLESALAELVDPDARVTVQAHVVHGPAAQALIEASTGAEVLVVGSRGRGGFAGLLLGSVSEQCVRHARCPVLVVRGQ